MYCVKSLCGEPLIQIALNIVVLRIQFFLSETSPLTQVPATRPHLNKLLFSFTLQSIKAHFIGVCILFQGLSVKFCSVC